MPSEHWAECVRQCTQEHLHHVELRAQTTGHQKLRTTRQSYVSVEQPTCMREETTNLGELGRPLQHAPVVICAADELSHVSSSQTQ